MVKVQVHEHHHIAAAVVVERAIVVDAQDEVGLRAVRMEHDKQQAKHGQQDQKGTAGDAKRPVRPEQRARLADIGRDGLHTGSPLSGDMRKKHGKKYMKNLPFNIT